MVLRTESVRTPAARHTSAPDGRGSSPFIPPSGRAPLTARSREIVAKGTWPDALPRLFGVAYGIGPHSGKMNRDQITFTTAQYRRAHRSWRCRLKPGYSYLLQLRGNFAPMLLAISVGTGSTYLCNRPRWGFPPLLAVPVAGHIQSIPRPTFRLYHGLFVRIRH